MGRRRRTGEDEAEVPDPKTSLENADPTKKNHGLENANSTKKNHGLRERRTREEAAAQESKRWNLSLKNSSSTWIFFHIHSHHLPLEF